MINIGPQDNQLLLNTALPAAGQTATSAVLDMQSIAPNSDSWRLGRLAVTFPALGENTGTGITIALQAAPPNLTAGSSQAAPQLPGPGQFVTPTCSQTVTIAGVAGTGSAAGVAYFTLAFDPNGSPYQFYQFLFTTPAGTVTQGENIAIAWEFA